MNREHRNCDQKVRNSRTLSRPTAVLPFSRRDSRSKSPRLALFSIQYAVAVYRRLPAVVLARPRSPTPASRLVRPARAPAARPLRLRPTSSRSPTCSPANRVSASPLPPPTTCFRRLPSLAVLRSSTHRGPWRDSYSVALTVAWTFRHRTFYFPILFLLPHGH